MKHRSTGHAFPLSLEFIVCWLEGNGNRQRWMDYMKPGLCWPDLCCCCLCAWKVNNNANVDGWAAHLLLLSVQPPSRVRRIAFVVSTQRAAFFLPVATVLNIWRQPPVPGIQFVIGIRGERSQVQWVSRRLWFEKLIGIVWSGDDHHSAVYWLINIQGRLIAVVHHF